jgi:cobalt-zinc-cadmium efflux system protein
MSHDGCKHNHAHTPGSGHDHHHGHDHTHGHAGHSHAPKDFGRAFLGGIVLNIGFVLVETIYGFLANSTALLADAGHNLSDVLGLVVAWVGAAVARRAASERFTFGLGRASILAALTNAVLLLIAVGAIGWEVIQRFTHPEPVAGITVMVVAGIGILINGFTAWLFVSGHDDINIRGAYLHMAADAGVSAGVVVAGLIIWWTGWLWVDPVISLAILIAIVWSGWGLMRDSIALSLDAVPGFVDRAAVRAFLAGQPGVTAVKDLRLWPLSTTSAGLTARLVMPAGSPGDDVLHAIAEDLKENHRIGHATLQIERGEHQN